MTPVHPLQPKESNRSYGDGCLVTRSRVSQRSKQAKVYACGRIRRSAPYFEAAFLIG